MIDTQLLEYIKNEIAKGTSEETITNTLLGSGWTLSTIQAHIFEAKKIAIPMSRTSQDSNISQTAHPSSPPQTVVVKKRYNIFLVNFIIFTGYLLLSLFSIIFSYESDLTILSVFFGALIHCAALLIVFVFQVIRWMVGEKDTRALHYLLCAIILFTVGFGTCFYAVSQIHI